MTASFIVLIAIFIYASIGIFGTIMDWTEEFNLTKEDLFIVVVAGTLMGPFSFIVWRIHSFNRKDPHKIIIKQRK